MTTPDKSHIGKRVKFNISNEEMVGTLASVAKHRFSPGFFCKFKERTLEEFYITSYELINEPMTLETLGPGTLLKNKYGAYRKVLAVSGGEGELKVYVLSQKSANKDSNSLKRSEAHATAFELKEDYYTIVDDSQEVVVTMEEIAKLKGVDVSQIRVKE